MYKFPKGSLITSFFIALIFALWVRMSPSDVFEMAMHGKPLMLIFYIPFFIAIIKTIKEILRYNIVRKCMFEGKYVIGEVIRKTTVKINNKTHYSAVCRYVGDDGKKYTFRSDYYKRSVYPFEEGDSVRIFVDIDKHRFLYYVYPNERM